MQRLSYGGVIGPQGARHGMDSQRALPRDSCDGRLDFVHQGHHIAGIARIPCGHTMRKDEARGRVRRKAGLTPKLCGTIALAFEDGCDSEIIGIDQFTVRQFLAVGEPGGLLADVCMAAQGRAERFGDTLALGVTQRRRLVQALLGLLPQGGNRLAKLQELLFRLAYQFHQDLALTTTLATKAAHNFFQLLVELLGLAREDRGTAAVFLRDGFDERKHFFCALYSVVASVTRWLPCSQGKVSMTRCAGLTSPSSMAAAAWMASNSSLRASSRRLRNSQRVSGKTK